MRKRRVYGKENRAWEGREGPWEKNTNKGENENIFGVLV